MHNHANAYTQSGTDGISSENSYSKRSELPASLYERAKMRLFHPSGLLSILLDV
jgi:hypothetical protein